MVASTDKGPNKTAFLTEHLGKNPKATTKKVNLAWAAAGHSGTISPTLVSKLRSDLGLAGNLRGGRKTGEAGSTPQAPKLRGRKKAAAKDANGKSAAESNGTHADAPRPRAPRSSEREQILAELEGDIDRLIFKMMAVGGLEEIEDELRRVRRVLVRGHKA